MEIIMKIGILICCIISICFIVCPFYLMIFDPTITFSGLAYTFHKTWYVSFAFLLLGGYIYYNLGLLKKMKKGK